MKVFVTGGSGYIGSHTILELISQEHEVFVLDNFSNSSNEVMSRIEKLTGRTCNFINLDLRDTNNLISSLKSFNPQCVIHFAGLKSVSDSISHPIEYYDNNVFGSLSLLKAMDEVGCNNIIFSSSATVYGEPKYLPIDEEHTCNPVNTYGSTKYFIEKILHDWVRANKNNSALVLRYFNPVGAHHSGCIGEDPSGIPNNLMPYISQVAIGKRPHVKIFGNDYPTRDGTGERDYIHVMDLAKAHVSAIPKLNKGIFDVYNVGTGSGTTVMELLKEYEKVCGRNINFKFLERRSGDVAKNVACADKAVKELSWVANYDLTDICADEWRWKTKNPKGYNQK